MHQTLEARQSNEPRPTACALRRVSVYADSLHVDLVLSAVVPIGSLIPPIVDTLAAQRGHRAQPVAVRHQLSLPGKTPLDPSKSLSQLGIRDGTVFILTSSSTVLTPPRFDDVAEAVSVSLGATVRPWTRQTARLIGALAIIKPKFPGRLRIFLLTLAVVDDVGALLVIAVFYSGAIQVPALLASAVLVVRLP